jgi:transposase
VFKLGKKYNFINLNTLKMEKKNKRVFSAEFKAKVVIESLKERSTIAELAARYELHPNQISTWKAEFINKAANIFSMPSERILDKKEQEEQLEKLYSQIGQQKMEIEWLKKKL